MNKKGFTLVELLAVIVILGLVMTIVGTKGFGAFDNTKKAITKQNESAIKEAANVIMTEVKECDEELSKDIIEHFVGKSKTCSDLKAEASKEECLDIRLDYMINNNFITGNGANDVLKTYPNYTVKGCLDDEKITIKLPTKEELEKDEDNNNPQTPDEDNKETDNTFAAIIKKNATEAKTNGSQTRTILGSEQTTFNSSSDYNEKVLNTAPDDYGNSYYFRGNVIDNYVTFAGLTWRIVRINGDNTVRIILDDIAKDSSNNIIRTQFNNTTSNSNAYVGYMYGETEDNNSYDATHENKNDSTIKIAVDKWFETNINETNRKYLADTLFCGDKSLAITTKQSANLGYYQQPTDYAVMDRYISNTLNPTFECAKGANNNYSRYTVTSQSTEKGVETNGNLKYPIGLLSLDETMFAGNKPLGKKNQSYYLYNSSFKEYWWLLTPSDYSFSLKSRVYLIKSTDGSSDVLDVSQKYGFRPVLNLKSNLLVENGDGTKENPYILKAD